MVDTQQGGPAENKCDAYRLPNCFARERRSAGDLWRWISCPILLSLIHQGQASRLVVGIVLITTSHFRPGQYFQPAKIRRLHYSVQRHASKSLKSEALLLFTHFCFFFISYRSLFKKAKFDLCGPLLLWPFQRGFPFYCSCATRIREE